MLTRQEAAKQRQQQQQQQQQKAAALQNRPDNMLGASGGTASWASLCEQAPQPGGRYYQPQDQQQQGYSGSGGLPPQQPVLNLAKVSRNNESQRTPRRAADAAAVQHHQQHLQSLQAQLGAGGTAGSLPMNVDSPNEGLTLPGPGLSGARPGGAYPTANQQPATLAGARQQALPAAQYQQQARYVVPPSQQYPHSARLSASSAAFGSGIGQQQAQQAQQQAQQQAPASARGFMQRLPHFFGGGGGSCRGGRGSSDAAHANQRAAPAASKNPVNPYLQVLPCATARPHYPGATDGGRLPQLQCAPASARNPGPATARSLQHGRAAPAGPAAGGGACNVQPLQQPALGPLTAVHGDQLLLVDSPGSSTGLTPRAAGMMRPSPVSPRRAPAAWQQPNASGLGQLQGQGMQGRVQRQPGGDSGHLFAVGSGPGHAPGQHTSPAQQAQQQQAQYQQVQYQQAQYQQAPGQRHAAGADQFANLQGCAKVPAAVTSIWGKPVGGLQESGPVEADTIRAVYGHSQAHPAPQQALYHPLQQEQQHQPALASLHSSSGSLGATSLELPAQQPQHWAAPALVPAQPAPAWEWSRHMPQQPADGSFAQSYAQQQTQLQQAQYPPQQQAGPLLPGLPYVEHALPQQAQAVGLPPPAGPAMQQLPPHLGPPPPGSDLDLIAAVTEEVAEYDMMRQQELEQQQQAAAVAAAARRVSQLATGPPAVGALVPTPSSPGTSPARAGSSRSSRRASPLGSGAGSPDSPAGRRPLTAARALQQWAHLLTPYEQSEILAFQSVWFVGRPGVPKMRGDKSSLDPNHGYDDNRGDYLPVVGDHIAYRFEVVGTLGRGSFGQVLRCIDHAHGQPVALKMIRSKRRFQKQAAIEAGILALLKEKDPDDAVNIVRCHESFTFRNHLCITFELLSINLYEYVKANNFQGCSLSMIRRVGQQVLLTLRFLLRLNIVHCDLKPENILLRERGRTAVKVIDFGSSCYADQRVYTYIQSRFYRSPEVILGLPYGPPIDMWSLGCILAELLTGQPIFPGEDEKEQLACIMELLGPPPRTLLEHAPRASIFFDTATWHPLLHQNSRGKARRPSSRNWERALGSCEDKPFCDFLQRCLVWEPELRMTPDQAQQHPWVTGGGQLGGVPAPQPCGQHLASGVGSAQSASWPSNSGGSSQESGAGSALASLASGLLSGTARVAAGFL
ncbi:hypothetical protein ABPG77_005500 [Micractinium sp. CCAP 211/92]